MRPSRLALPQGGETIEILNPRIGDEWALAKKPDGDMGLIPHGCYVTIHDFTGTSPSPTSPTFPPSGSIDGPIRMQSTGESIITSSLYTLRQSVLGGKSLNRFSHFVVTGAEEWIINGYDPPVATSRSHERFRTDVTVDETDEEVGRHYVEVNLPTKSRKTDKWDDTEGCTQANMSWREKTPAFNVLVHSPEKHSSVTGAYTLYSVTSIFPPSSPKWNRQG
ncbi:WASP-binding domain of Sorting nexin protein [Rhizoctonia solani]|uniref:WASP-binding domain of Sorting nexin protein n=1 Tax=Rhizoctonia solani TaxID=456999 RepID=A0A8H7IP69_9AGAM|nr:WASP-binding domain of Sorting nexin protein [Rhizoctonia solani]